MNNLPTELINALDSSVKLHPLIKVDSIGLSSDPAQKFLFRTSKNNKIIFDKYAVF